MKSSKHSTGDSPPSYSESTSVDSHDERKKPEAPPPTTPAAAASQAKFADLFSFTEHRHAGPLALAVLAAALAAGTKTIYAILLGKVVDLVVPLGLGTMSKAEVLSGVSFWALILTVLGVAAWITNSALMAFWVVFGELVAKNTREKLFHDLMYKNMGWYDSQEEGVSSTLSAMQV